MLTRGSFQNNPNKRKMSYTASPAWMADRWTVRRCPLFFPSVYTPPTLTNSLAACVFDAMIHLKHTSIFRSDWKMLHLNHFFFHSSFIAVVFFFFFCLVSSKYTISLLNRCRGNTAHNFTLKMRIIYRFRHRQSVRCIWMCNISVSGVLLCAWECVRCLPPDQSAPICNDMRLCVCVLSHVNHGLILLFTPFKFLLGVAAAAASGAFVVVRSKLVSFDSKSIDLIKITF